MYAITGVISESECSVKKGHFFTTKRLKGHPKFDLTLCSYSLYNCFGKTNF